MHSDKTLQATGAASSAKNNLMPDRQNKDCLQENSKLRAFDDK